MQERYLRSPERRTWIQVGLCVAVLASLWISVGIFIPAAYSLVSPLAMTFKATFNHGLIVQLTCFTPLITAQIMTSLIAIMAMAIPAFAIGEIPYPIARIFVWNALFVS